MSGTSSSFFSSSSIEMPDTSSGERLPAVPVSLPAWRGMLAELCQSPAGQCPQSRMQRGRVTGQARPSAALGAAGTRGGQNSRTEGAQPAHCGLPRWRNWRNSAGMGHSSHGEKMPAQQAHCIWQPSQITSLFPPPMGEQGDPQHCGGVINK